MYSDKLLLLKLDDIQDGLYQLNNHLNASDSLAVSKLSDMSSSLSDISTYLVTNNQNTFWGTSWDILLPVLISTIVSLGIFTLGAFVTSLRRKRQTRGERKMVKDAIVFWAEENIPHLRSYILSIRILADKIKIADEMQPQAFPAPILTIDVLSEFTIDRLTDSLYKGLPPKLSNRSKMLNAYLSSVSFIMQKHVEVKNTYEKYNSQFIQYMTEWNQHWSAFKKDVLLNYNRVIATPPIPIELQYYIHLVGLINPVLQGNAAINPPFSPFQNLMTAINQYDNTINGPTPVIISTSFLAGDLCIIAAQINMMKKYGQMFSDMADALETTVTNFETATVFYRNNEIV